MRLATTLSGPRGANLDLLRQALAICVIVSHAWPLALGAGTPEPLDALTGRSLGGWAVGAFFFLSGLLIAASAERRSPRAFWRARARRILPGLSVALLVTLALAVASGARPSALEATEWYLRAVSLVSIEHRLSGAFAANPLPGVINGPLWSLFHEVAAYGLCTVLVWTGLVSRLRGLACVMLLAAAACLVEAHLPSRMATFAPLFLAFACGMAVHRYRTRIPLRLDIALILLAGTLVLPWQAMMGPVGFALTVIALRLPALSLRGDPSFGLYIYGWPVAQSVLVWLPGLSPLALAGLSLALTYPVAWLSWQWVERPGLRPNRVVA